jgi:hypothetical protein
LAWLTLLPTWRPLPVSSQIRDMIKLASKNAGKFWSAMRGRRALTDSP